MNKAWHSWKAKATMNTRWALAKYFLANIWYPLYTSTLHVWSRDEVITWALMPPWPQWMSVTGRAWSDQVYRGDGLDSNVPKLLEEKDKTLENKQNQTIKNKSKKNKKKLISYFCRLSHQKCLHIFLLWVWNALQLTLYMYVIMSLLSSDTGKGEYCCKLLKPFVILVPNFCVKGTPFTHIGLWALHLVMVTSFLIGTVFLVTWQKPSS